MRHGLLLAGLVCLLAGASGCDTEQPLRVGERELELEILATNALVNVYDVWEQYFDADKDGVPDEFDPDGKPLDPPVQVVCRQVVDVQGNPLQTTANSAPWGYSLRIKLIPSGSADPVVLSSQAAENIDFNLTPYDDLTGQQPTVPVTCLNDPYDAVVCTPLGRVTGANRLVIESRFDLASMSQPPDLFFRVGVANPLAVFRCPGAPGLRDATLGGTAESPQPPPFRISMSPGDTILVEARKNTAVENGVEVLNEPVLAGEVRVGGRVVQPFGTVTSTASPGDGIFFSYTAQ